MRTTARGGLAYGIALAAAACSATAPASTEQPTLSASTKATAAGQTAPAPMGTQAAATSTPSAASTGSGTQTSSPGSVADTCTDVLEPGDGRVVFMVGNAVSDGIAMANADGSDYRLIVEPVDPRQQPHGGTEAPRWTPDGRILFDSNRSGGPDDWHIFIVDADGANLEQVTGGAEGIENYPVLSADGSTLVFSKSLVTPNGPGPYGGGGIFVSDPDGANERQVTAVPEAATPEFPEGAVDEWPDISPDGKRIVFTRGHSPEGGLFIVDVDGGGLTRLTDSDVQPLRPRWSPDGEWIAFHGNGNRFERESANVWLIRPDGSELTQVTFESVPGQAWAPDWSPDGDHLVFVHGADLKVMDVEGTLLCTFRAHTSTLHPLDPDWGPSLAENTSDLVGEWARDTHCQEVVDRLAGAGMDDWVLEYASAFVPGASGPEDVADPNEPCAGAVPLRHSHFFTADGRFGSRDENGDQVDEGVYRILDDGTMEISSECDCIGDVAFHYEIAGDQIQFEPVIPGCAPECFAAVWSVTVAYAGLPWTRVEP